jgi:hypothetical protein
MIRFVAVFSILLASPVLAGGPAWDDFVADENANTRILGAVGACVNAVTDPQGVASVLRDAGWQEVEVFDRTLGFEVDGTSLMISETPGFCMIETSDFSTSSLTELLVAFDIPPTGQDDAGCTEFTMEATTATLNGGGNDPACTSNTEAVLRFEVTE